MAGRFQTPYPQFFNSTPTPLSGAKLFFYAAGTSTKLDTYSNRTLVSANLNPVALNSAGYPDVEIWLQDLDYKVVLAPSTDSDPPTSAIWSSDYVRARDSALIAKTVPVSGSPNGSVGGTAASAGVLPDFAWDYTNSILYICTTSGISGAAVWTAINASTAAAVTPMPQGYLTLTSGTPVIASDVAAATAVYYAVDQGNLVPIYNGTSFVPTVFTELTLTLSSSHTASNIYDVFVFSNSGVVTIGTGPTWSAGSGGSITAGSCARGTGAGGTALARVNGVYTNSVSMTARNGATTYTVAANQGTYVGSLFMDGSNGQITCHRSYGQSRKWGVWNAYNRRPIVLQSGDATASWTTAPTTWRQSRADTTNFTMGFCGLPEEIISAEFIQAVAQNYSGTGCAANIGVGVNSTTVLTGRQGSSSTAAGAGTALDRHDMVAQGFLAPAIGINQFNMLEQATSGTTANSFIGASTDMLMTLRLRG